MQEQQPGCDYGSSVGAIASSLTWPAFTDT
jgi:hypothetical protein